MRIPNHSRRRDKRNRAALLREHKRRRQAEGRATAWATAYAKFYQTGGRR